MRKINRRKFIVSTAAGATGIGLLAGCNARSLVGDDIRPPSAPTGLDGYVTYEQDGVKKARLSWNTHDLTDITGAPSETKISGYHLFCEDKKLNAQLLAATSYADTAGPDNSGLVEGRQYRYHITAVDMAGNESPASNSLRLKVAPPSKIFSVTHPDACTGLTLNPQVVQTMLHAAVMAYTETSTVAAAYESLFPGLTGSSTIAIKINCLAGNGLCTHPDVVNAIITGLRAMRDGSFPVRNIIVFDDRMRNMMNSAGFPLKNPADDYKVLSTYGETDPFGHKNWSDTVWDVSGSTQRQSRIAEQADYIINVPVLKDHSSAGITFALKNFYGIVDKPGVLHTLAGAPGNTWCDPYIAAVYKHAAHKVALIVGDAILGAHRGGPSTAPTFTPKTLLVCNDPVAMDMHALKMINDQRILSGMYSITTEPDPQTPGRADARHIMTASAEPYELGTTNREIIEVPL